MIQISSIDTIRKYHDFNWELLTIPAVGWMAPEEIEDYKQTIEVAVKKIEAIDSNLELLLGDLDEHVALAVQWAFSLEEPVSSAKEFRLKKYPPQGKVQIQRDSIEHLIAVGRGEETSFETVQEEIGADKFKALWEVNPKIGKIKIDDEEVELNLQESLGHFLTYLNACEHEFLKQFLATNLRRLLHQYHFFIMSDLERKGQEVERKLINDSDYLLNYSRLGRVVDEIYYRRAKSFLYECGSLWNFLNTSEFSSPYLLEDEDFRS